MKLEKEIEQSVIKWAMANGWLTKKIYGFDIRGWPDRVFISPKGVHVWIEFKRPGQVPRKLQQHWIDLLNAHCARATAFDDAEAAIEYLESCNE